MAGAPNPARDQHTGRRLGKYHVVCRLSSGGMAEIFLAFQRGVAGFGKVVVLKKILPDVQAEAGALEDFMDEAQLTATFNHPQIAQVYDLDRAEDELFLVMEFVQGATLVEVAEACHRVSEPIPTGFSLAACRDTALALHYAHTYADPLGQQRQVIHRDVAEKNIMVTYEGTTKLLDFGIARAMERANRTQAGIVKGTTGYMAPEHVRGHPLDPRADVFSLGVVLHELLTGRRLFYGNSMREEMLAVLQKVPSPPSERNPEVTPALDALVLKALARDKEARFGSALEMARALEEVGAASLWKPDRAGALIQRFFSDRRERLHRLLLEVQALPEEPKTPLGVAHDPTVETIGAAYPRATDPRRARKSSPARRALEERPPPPPPVSLQPSSPDQDEEVTRTILEIPQAAVEEAHTVLEIRNVQLPPSDEATVLRSKVPLAAPSSPPEAPRVDGARLGDRPVLNAARTENAGAGSGAGARLGAFFQRLFGQKNR